MISELCKKFKETGFSNHILLLDLSDYLADFTKTPFINLLATKDFMTCLLLLLKIKDKSVLQSKVLYLIKKWAGKFQAQKIFADTYNTLVKSGVVFPENAKYRYKYIHINKHLDIINKLFDF